MRLVVERDRAVDVATRRPAALALCLLDLIERCLPLGARVDEPEEGLRAAVGAKALRHPSVGGARHRREDADAGARNGRVGMLVRLLVQVRVHAGTRPGRCARGEPPDAAQHALLLLAHALPRGELRLGTRLAARRMRLPLPVDESRARARLTLALDALEQLARRPELTEELVRQRREAAVADDDLARLDLLVKRARRRLDRVAEGEAHLCMCMWHAHVACACGMRMWHAHVACACACGMVESRKAKRTMKMSRVCPSLWMRPAAWTSCKRRMGGGCG